MESILDSIKQLLGISSDDTSFDVDLIIHINGALMIMNQLGVGPQDGYSITDKNDKWSDFLLDNKKLELVKTDVYLRVRLVFDPPQNSFLVAAIQKNIDEYDWRIALNTDPVSVPVPEPEV